jgi:nitrate reductase NapE component
MLTLLEAIAFVILVAVSFVGFAAALVWTFAIWFGNKG